MTLEACQVEHLILLVGENPLPNAVAAKLLVRSSGRITLLHSDKVARIAQNLHVWLAGQGFADVDCKEIGESDPISIVRETHNALSQDDGRSVGLHYTGGTKAMAVHAYRALEQWGRDRVLRPQFSYLDARRLGLIVHDAAPETGHTPHEESIAIAVELGFTDLLALHGWRPRTSRTEPRATPTLPGVARELASLNADSDTARVWTTWKINVLYAQAKRPDDAKNRWKPAGTLRSLALHLPDAPEASAVVAALRSELEVTGDTLTIGDAAARCGYREPEDFCKWLDGGWLEAATLDALLACQSECQLHNIFMGVEPATDVAGREVDFEFDVVALRGYQLFAVSCSTDEALEKLKLFEAFVRARQMGGDEARVALVCCAKDPNRLQAQMEHHVGEQGRIRVFGREHLKSLTTHLRDWIKAQSGS